MSKAKKELINVFIVDDDLPLVLENLSHVKECKFIGTNSFNLQALLAELDKHPECTILLIDIQNEDDRKAGIKLLDQLHDDPQWQKMLGKTQIILFSKSITAQHTYEAAKDKRIDIADLIAKEELWDSQSNREALEKLHLAHEKAEFYRHHEDLADPVLQECGLLFHPSNKKMRAVMGKVLLASRYPENVLIHGETGTGKELVARAIYDVMKKNVANKKSKEIRGSAGWLAYNIGSAPSEGNLQYTELFGAERGSFSGCMEKRIGLFERASDGLGKTIFLDEIGDAPKNVQVALLRVLQEKKITRLGGFNSKDKDTEIEVKFRLISASHAELPKKISNSEFREDLYYRLKTIEITIPSLRERKEDIPVLVYHFLNILNSEYKELNGHEKTIPDEKVNDVMAMLKAYSWPGNVRQLDSAIRTSYVMSPGAEFTLSDEVVQMLAGNKVESDPSPELAAKRIFDDLNNMPMSLTDIKGKHGIPTAIRVGNLFIDYNGKMPDEKEELQLFKCKGGAFKKWMNTNRNKT